MLVLLNDLLAKGTHLVIIVVNKLLSNDQDNVLKDRQVMLKGLIGRSWWMSLILFGGSKYTTTQVVCIYQIHRRKKRTFWQKNVQRGCVCDEMQLVVVLLPNTQLAN